MSRVPVVLLCGVLGIVTTVGSGPTQAAGPTKDPGKPVSRYCLPPSLLGRSFLFAGEKIPLDRPDVQYRIAAQVNFLLMDARSVLTEWLMERSRYSWIFDEVFAKEGIPREMSLLAPVISGLKGRTSARPGGMGWWSLTGLCGAAEGVEMAVDSWHDDRLDPDLSTRCFAQRLKETRKELNSSGWLMPVAAYLTSVKIIQDQKSRWNTEVFWDLPLPDIAEELVVRWIAFRIIDDHRAFYGLKFVDAPALAFDQLSGVVLSKDLSIAEMARIADAPAREILELNAKIKPSQPIFPAKVQGKPHAHTIFAPKGKGRALIDKLKDEGYLANVEGR